MDVSMSNRFREGRSLPSGNEIRQSIKRSTNRISNPRLSAALADPRITAIEDSVRRCNPSGPRRENWMYGRTVLPRVYVSLLDELNFPGKATREQIMALGDAMRDAAYATVYDPRVQESVDEVLAQESLIDGESAATANRLLKDPKDPGLLHAVAMDLGRERDAAEHARMVVMNEARPRSA